MSETATLLASDGVHLRADIRRTPNARAAVVVVHGFTAHRRQPAVIAMADALCDAALENCENEGRAQPACDGAQAPCRTSAKAEETFFDFVGRVLGDDSFLTDSQLREATLD